MSSGTALAFARGNGAGGSCNNNQIDVVYERVSLPVGNRVDAFTATAAANQDGASSVLSTPMDLTRAVAFYSGQGVLGQASGECTDTTVDRPRDCTMRASFIDSMTVANTRPTVAGTTAASLGLFVLQVLP
jgi:hypothetical protein